MPVTTDQMRHRSIVINHTVDFGDGISINFQFDRNRITDSWFSEWSRLENERNVGALNEVLADLIITWDIQEADGSAVAVTAERISELFNVPDKATIVQEFMTAAVPSRAEGNASSATSSTASTASTPPPATLQNGPELSPSPEPSTSPSPT